MSALLFDLDGTLIHSDPLHLEVFQEMFAERGRVFDEETFMRHVYGKSNAESFPHIFPGEDAELLSHLKEERFREKLGYKAHSIPGAETLIKDAKDRGWSVVVVTNAFRLNAEHMLKAIGLQSEVDDIVVGEECVAYKPDPAPYLEALRRFDLAPHQAVAFEDSPTGLRAAVGAGLKTVGIASTLNPQVLLDNGAHVVVPDYADRFLLHSVVFGVHS